MFKMLSNGDLIYLRKLAEYKAKIDAQERVLIKANSVLKMLDYIKYLEEENARLRRSL